MRFLLGSWAVCFLGEGGFMFSLLPSGLQNGVGLALIYPSPLSPGLFSTQWVTPGGLHPQFLYASANTRIHIHVHPPGSMPIFPRALMACPGRALPWAQASAPALSASPPQEGVGPHKHSETARMNHPAAATLRFGYRSKLSFSVHVSQV